MSQSTEQVRALMRAITDADTVEIYSGTVLRVDEANATCEVELMGELIVPNARLRTVVDGLKGIVPVPKVGSEVVMVEIDGGADMMVVGYSELTKVLIDVPEIKITADEVVINGGDNNGMVIIEKLKSNLDELKNFVEAMHQAMPSAFSAIGAGPSANGATGGSSYQGSMAGKTISLQDMENTKLKH